ncbi:hypothetical protein GCK72_016762 [Caenorhabditis remanei]|uniref:F-box domain-containing protein n=1 Tax=Caenorhabditis remanei TaxID=31234 RepID=A0A6A5G6B9_CAERE|nr:hypothetical protein GCK72_016762 [Caenorhabditis remanei]KAF1750215.1 hypothetical protein GCK72_016762 [Caenorhabditis remanei]
MKDPAKFPLLHLPLLAIKEVLSTLSPLDLVNFSLASLKSKKVAKYFFNQHLSCGYRLWLGIDEELRVGIIGTENIYYFRLISDKTKDGHREERKLFKYSEDPLSDFKKYVEYAIDTFCWPVSLLRFDLGAFIAQSISIIDWLKPHVETFTYFYLHSDIISDEYVPYFLNNIEVTWNLVLNTKMSDNFQLILPRSIKAFEILQSDFVTLDQLSSFDCEFIRLCNTKISNQELNQFFKNWMTSKSNINLQNFSIHIENMESLETILNLPHDRVDPGTVRTFRRYRRPFHVAGGIDIKRDDGKITTFLLEPYMEFLHLVMITR